MTRRAGGKAANGHIGSFKANATGRYTRAQSLLRGNDMEQTPEGDVPQ
jgi:hypothetical protein